LGVRGESTKPTRLLFANSFFPCKVRAWYQITH
jgi:hypothetical protein